MSHGGMSEQMAVLRQTVARLEGTRTPSFGGAAGCRAKVALGDLDRGLALDRVLGGGLRPGTLSEVVAGSTGDAGAASGFALALAARFAAEAQGPVVWVLEDGAGQENGSPYAPGLAAHGLDPERLIVVRVLNAADSLWATEEALKCRGLAAVVLDLWRTKTYDLVASRRLVLAAGASGTPGILVPAGAPGTARALSSAAHTRFEVAAAPGPHIAVGVRVPLPGRAAWSVRLARIRAGPAVAGFDWEKFWPLVWDHEEAWFCDALPLPPSALSADRPPQAARGAEGWRAA